MKKTINYPLFFKHKFLHRMSYECRFLVFEIRQSKGFSIKFIFQNEASSGTFGVVRFDLGSLLQGQTIIAKLKSAYISLIIGPRGLTCDTNL